MAFITRRGKKTIEPSMPHVVKDDMRKDKEVVETSGELVHNTVIEAEVSQKFVPILSPPPPFSQRLVKKTEDGKYQ